VRKSIRTHVGDLDVAAVPCGFGRAIGNKVWPLQLYFPWLCLIQNQVVWCMIQ